MFQSNSTDPVSICINIWRSVDGQSINNQFIHEWPNFSPSTELYPIVTKPSSQKHAFFVDQAKTAALFVDEIYWRRHLSIAMSLPLDSTATNFELFHFPRSAALLLRVGLMKMMKQTPTTKPATLKVHFVRSSGGGGGIPLESSSRACSRRVQASHHQLIYTWKGWCESFRIFWAKYCHKDPPMYLFFIF